MRPIHSTTKFAAGAAMGLVMAAAALMAPSTARAGDDDETPMDTKIIRGILEGIGLQRDGAGITYQERAPLVIPPTRDLPPPEPSQAAIANNPAWPKDPDVQRAKLEKKMERQRASVGAGEQIMRDESVLRPDQMTPGGSPRTPPSGRRESASLGVDGGLLSPSQLGYKGGLFSNMFGSSDDTESTRFTGEPGRAALTDPPVGYQTPSPAQPYGKGRAAPTKPADDYVTRGEMRPDKN